MTEQPRDPKRNDLTGAPPPVSGEAEYGSAAVSDETLDQIASATVYDVDGDKVGSVGRVYLRDETGSPSWVTVKSGFFGLRESLMPMRGVHVVGGEVRVPYSKDMIKGAPHVDMDEHLSPAEEDELRRYYGVPARQRGDERAGAPDTADITDTDADVVPVDSAPEQSRVNEPGDTADISDTDADVVPVDPAQEQSRVNEPGDTAEVTPEAGVDVSEVDDQHREERFDDMERRTDRLKDTTVEDALVAGSVGVAGAGVAQPTDLPRHDAAGVDADARAEDTD